MPCLKTFAVVFARSLSSSKLGKITLIGCFKGGGPVVNKLGRGYLAKKCGLESGLNDFQDYAAILGQEGGEVNQGSAGVLDNRNNVSEVIRVLNPFVLHNVQAGGHFTDGLGPIGNCALAANKFKELY